MDRSYSFFPHRKGQKSTQRFSMALFFFAILIKSIEEGIRYIFLSAEKIIIITNDWDCGGRWDKKHPMKPSHPAVLERIFHIAVYTPSGLPSPPSLHPPNPDRYYPRLGGTLRRFLSIYYQFHCDDFLVIRSRKELAMCHQNETSPIRLGGHQDVSHHNILNFISTILSSFIQEGISDGSTEGNIINTTSPTQQRKLQSIGGRFSSRNRPWATKWVNYLASPSICVEKTVVKTLWKRIKMTLRDRVDRNARSARSLKANEKNLYQRWQRQTDSLQ